MKGVLRVDFRSYYHLESYLFDTARPHYLKNGYLNAFDFFCIVIWKAQRAKSRIAHKLQKVEVDLDKAVYVLTWGLAQQSNPKDRLRVLWQADFNLPIASAILTVLYPEDFTVYDERVCSILGDFHKIKSLRDFDALWDGYQDYKRKVKESTPKELSLRDKDRYLWGKSFYEQLVKDINKGFKKLQKP